jgi:hypothetical protein
MHNKMIKIKYRTCDHLLFKGSEFLSLKLIYCLKTTNLFGITKLNIPTSLQNDHIYRLIIVYYLSLAI